MPTSLRLPFDDDPPGPIDPLLARDEAARRFAVDPTRNVVLEASAGTGKTRVLVTRYLNLIRAGVDPANILAITFTRKAAAEMRERIVRELAAMAGRSPADAARWRDLRDRLGDVGISTIDAFCLSLLREFPLEADLDPGFQVADETEVPRFADEALDAALRAARRLSRSDEDVSLLMAGLGERKVRAGLAALLGRRLVAHNALRRFVAGAPATPPGAAFAQAAERLAALLDAGPGGIGQFAQDGPAGQPEYAMVEADLRALGAKRARVSRAVLDRLSAYFLTKTGTPRQRPAPAFHKADCPSPAAWTRHARTLGQVAPYVADILAGLQRDLNLSMARGVDRLCRITVWQYRRALERQAAVDFSEALSRTLALLRRMDEFAQSRYRLEARYHHVLVDEFQDTSRPQWVLVSRLIEAWGEGVGLAHDAPLQPSIFIVGDRKQSIYAFRDADVRILRRARRRLGRLRPDGSVRRSISRSFRSAPALLAFSNDLFAAIEKVPARADAFRYGPRDEFPVHLAASAALPRHALGLAAAASSQAAAAAVASEVGRLLQDETVRDRQTGLPRDARPGDIAILFRSRESHRDVEAALERRGIPTYVYKGLGFFDADEVKDLLALLRFLADPSSDLRAAAFLRSRFVRLSDVAMSRLAPAFAARLHGGPAPSGSRARVALPAEDAGVLRLVHRSLPSWLSLVDRLPPAEVLDRIIDESAYAFELAGPRRAQARENVKKVRALLRRIQNRGYATLPRIAEHLERLSAGDESNAVIDAADAVNLMTVHAAKGLEFPIVFLVNLGRGTGTRGEPFTVIADASRPEPIVSVARGLPEAEAAVRARDLEETKRLLYVAVTRARERLYLSAVVKDGRFKPGRGSLGEVLPLGIREALEKAAAAPDTASVEWQATGGLHAFRVCAAGDETAPATSAARAEPAAETGVNDLAPWLDVRATRRMPVTDLASGAGTAAAAGRLSGADAAARRLAGTLAHRLFPAFDGVADPDEEAVSLRARALISHEEIGTIEDVEGLVARAVSSFLAIRARPDVMAWLEHASCLYEVPFSLAATDADSAGSRDIIVRGTIDCLARLQDGRVMVVEIKTGTPREWHQAQLEWYVRAARELFPGEPVEGTVLYV